MTLASRSMLVALNQRVWQAQTTDRRLASNLEHETEAENRSMRVIKSLAPQEYILPIRRIAIFGREQHEKLTLPGFMRGQQLLATKLFDEYALRQAEIKEEFNSAVKHFCNYYPNIIDAAPRRLGKAFRASDFPSTDRIPSYFAYEIRFSPVPETGNWLVEDVDLEDMDRIRNQVEDEKNAVFREATKELMQRVSTVLENLHSQAVEYPDEGPSFGKLRDVTLTAVKEMAVLLPAMNIVNDPTLAAVGREMADKFGRLEAKSLRTNKDERLAVAKLASNILEKMKGMSF